MRVFVTGASGFIGLAVVRELVAAGHEVTGLARSAAAAAKLAATGATVQRGSIEHLGTLREAASKADGVIHTAFFHAFSQAGFGTRMRVMLGGMPTGLVRRFMVAAVEADRLAIDTLGHALRAQARPLVIAFPTMAMRQGRPAVETDFADPDAVGGLRARCEKTALALAGCGVDATVIRLPPSVHDQTRQGLVTQLVAIARKKRVSAYVGDGQNRWAAVHRLDASHLFRLALEDGRAGARYHAVAEEGITLSELAGAIGQHLGVRTVSLTAVEAVRHFGWLAPFVGADNPVSSRATREQLHWQPTRPPLMTDLAASIASHGMLARRSAASN